MTLLFPVAILLNYFLNWDTGEWPYSPNGFGRLQEFIFPWTAWGGLLCNVVIAEVKIIQDQDFWCESEGIIDMKEKCAAGENFLSLFNKNISFLCIVRDPKEL